MAVMVASVGALAAFYHDSTDINDPQQRMIASMRMIAKIPTLAAMAYKYTIGQPFMYPKNSLSFAENFLNMCFAVPCEDYKINPVLAEALDKIFILHADHEQNASTSTVRIAGSSGANPFACIAAGIACLWGPAHGGANEAALAMLAGIGTVDKIPDFIKKVKDKNSEVRLMGFGHRVYKNYDPRAKIMQKMCHAVLAETGHGDDPMLNVALELEKIALSDSYFIDRKLYPNVDFYSGITLKAMGFPTSMFTADKKLVKQAVMRTSAAGGTRLFDSVAQVSRDLEARPGKKALVVFTDGDDNASMLNAAGASRQASQSGVPIYIIAQGTALKDARLMKILDEMAANTGGIAFRLTRPEKIGEVFSEISRNLRHTYLLSWKLPEGAGKTWHPIKITVAGAEDARIRARLGYWPE